MSWHHNDYISLFSASASVIAAVSAAIAAFQSSKISKASYRHQKNMAKFERDRYLRELLRHDAIKANESVQSPYSSTWTFPQVANIASALESAKQRIVEAGLGMTDIEIAHFKSYFKSQLSHEITKELNQTSPPDCMYLPEGSAMLSLEASTLWHQNKEYFNFTLVTIEDLAD